jgi:hypothetical protein
VFVHTGYNKAAAAAMSVANAAKPKEKQQQAKQERVSNKKATATSTAGPDSAGDSNESSARGNENKPKRQRQRRAVTYDLKVQGLAWATTAEGLAQHFSDCKVGPGKEGGRLMLQGMHADTVRLTPATEYTLCQTQPAWEVGSMYRLHPAYVQRGLWRRWVSLCAAMAAVRQVVTSAADLVVVTI